MDKKKEDIKVVSIRIDPEKQKEFMEFANCRNRTLSNLMIHATEWYTKVYEKGDINPLD